MPIVRGHHEFDDFFTRIPNAWVRDQRLSLKAIGLLVQLLSHSPGWRVSVASLAEANDCGMDLIRSAVKELVTAGYLRRRQERVDTRFGEAVYETCDPDTPSSAFPSSAFPSSGNPTPKKNITKNNSSKNVYGDADTLFERFWSAYPRKVGRQAAYRAFLTLITANNPLDVISGASRLADDPNLPPKQFVPYPATWLNRHGWLDEALPERILTFEEQKAKELALAAKRNATSRAQSAEIQQLMREIEAKAEPAPKCKHGKNLATCLPCCREVAKNGDNGNNQ